MMVVVDVSRSPSLQLSYIGPCGCVRAHSGHAADAQRVVTSARSSITRLQLSEQQQQAEPQLRGRSWKIGQNAAFPLSWRVVRVEKRSSEANAEPWRQPKRTLELCIWVSGPVGGWIGAVVPQSRAEPRL